MTEPRTLAIDTNPCASRAPAISLAAHVNSRPGYASIVRLATSSTPGSAALDAADAAERGVARYGAQIVCLPPSGVAQLLDMLRGADLRHPHARPRSVAVGETGEAVAQAPEDPTPARTWDDAVDALNDDTAGGRLLSAALAYALRHHPSPVTEVTSWLDNMEQLPERLADKLRTALASEDPRAVRVAALHAARTVVPDGDPEHLIQLAQYIEGEGVW